MKKFFQILTKNIVRDGLSKKKPSHATVPLMKQQEYTFEFGTRVVIQPFLNPLVPCQSIFNNIRTLSARLIMYWMQSWGFIWTEIVESFTPVLFQPVRPIQSVKRHTQIHLSASPGEENAQVIYNLCTGSFLYVRTSC